MGGGGKNGIEYGNHARPMPRFPPVGKFPRTSAERAAAFAQSPTKPDILKAFRVSDAVRRRKVDGARTRGPHAVSYGDLDFGPVRASAEGADKRTGLGAARPILQ